MQSVDPTLEWRGYVNHITYGTELSHRVADSLVARLADELIRQRYFVHPVDTYYRAAASALQSKERLALTDYQDDEVIRDLLSRLLAALDERRPWPEPPFYKGDPSEWSELRDAPAIGRIAMTERHIGEHLNRVFSERTGDDGARVLILHLQTGQHVALLARRPFNEPGVDVVARGEAVSTAAAFQELTGIKVDVR